MKWSCTLKLGTSPSATSTCFRPAILGYTVDDEDDDNPILLGPDGKPVTTWKEDYPYQDRMTRRDYESHQTEAVQIELLKLQGVGEGTGANKVIIFEGRDAAGKGGTIKRFMEHLNPRGAPVVRWRSPPTRAGAVVLPAVRAHLPVPRGDRPVRPFLVQPGRRGKGHGLLHARARRRILGAGAGVRADAHPQRHTS